MSKDELEKIRNIRIAKLLGCKDGFRQTLKCPFHSEKSGSFVLYPDNSYHCFGCNKNGRGAIDFCISLGYSFQESVDELLKYL